MPPKYPRTEAQKKADKKYHQTAMRAVKFEFHRTSDADILEKLDSVPVKAQYIRELIRADIAKQKKDS